VIAEIYLVDEGAALEGEIVAYAPTKLKNPTRVREWVDGTYPLIRIGESWYAGISSIHDPVGTRIRVRIGSEGRAAPAEPFYEHRYGIGAAILGLACLIGAVAVHSFERRWRARNESFAMRWRGPSLTP
jgi:hypothetical protein